MTPEQLEKELKRIKRQLCCLDSRVDSIEESPVSPDTNDTIMLAELVAGAVSDDIETNTKAGAVSTAVVSKVGNFDKFEVTGGAFNTSYIYFNNIGFCELDPVMRIKVKIENPDKDGSSGNCLLGIGKHQIQIDNDFSQTFPAIYTVDLINKTVQFDVTSTGSVGSQYITASTGDLVNDGDTIELIVKNHVDTSAKVITVNNLTTGAFLNCYFDQQSARHRIGIRQGLLRINMANADFTILECDVTSSSVYRPYAHVIGDSFGSGYDIMLYQSVWGRMRALRPWNVSASASAGSAMAGIHRFQLREVLNLKAQYVILISIITLFQDEFDSLDADYADWILRFDELMTAIIGYGGIPVIPRWNNSAFAAGNNDEWDTFIDDYILPTYPTTRIVDFRNIGIVYSDSNHPSAASHDAMARAIINVIE